MKRRRKRQSTEDRSLRQAARLIDLARERGCTHLKWGQFECALGPVGEPRDRVGFDVAPTPPDEFYEARGRKV